MQLRKSYHCNTCGHTTINATESADCLFTVYKSPSTRLATDHFLFQKQIFDTNKVFVAFSSLTSPKTVYEYDMARGTKTVAKRTPVLGFDDLKYATARLEVTARNGMKIPVSLAWKKVVGDDVKGGQTEDTPPLNSPVLLSGYGSYGVSCDPSFSREDVPLLDRGVVIAVAHVRGGGELGKAWYETHGKYLTKKVSNWAFPKSALRLFYRSW